VRNTLSKLIRFIFLPTLFAFLLLGFFVLGAISDRLFYIKPLDYIYKRGNNSILNTPNISYNGKEDIADVTEASSKSVVTISIKTLPRSSSVYNLFDLNFFRQPRQLQPKQEEIKQDIGSGFVVEGGFVVTNKHVVSNPTGKYRIVDNEDKEYEVSEIYRDPANDLAILKVNDLQLAGLPLGDSDKLRVGQKVIAIGTALGEFRHTVTTGVISGLGRGITASSGFGDSEELDNVIQTDAAINPGNSGGPLLDMGGNVVGINAAISQGAENIGFALPINLLKNSLQNFNSTGQFERPYLGVRYQTISKKSALQNEVPAGAYVEEVIEDSPAAKAGIKSGDIVVELDGEAVGEKNLATMINKKKIGDTIKVKIYRWDEEKDMEFQVKLEKLPSQ
jgi:S1-C subfamily serine protease